MTVCVKLPPNSGHLLIMENFLKTCRFPLFRGFAVSKSMTVLKPFLWFTCPRPNLGHEWGGKLTQLLSSTTLLLIWPEGHQESRYEVASWILARHTVRFELETFWFWDWRDSPLFLLKTCNGEPNLIDLN